MCLRRVYANFRLVHNLKFLFRKAAKCGTEREFDAVMDELEVYAAAAKENFGDK